MTNPVHSGRPRRLRGRDPEIGMLSRDDRLRSIINRVGGQPLWLVELLKGLHDEGLVTIADNVAHLVGDAIPRRLLESVSDQLARLSAQTRRGLQTASVLGRSFSVDELASLMDLPAASIIEPMREALAAGLIVDRENRLGFRHDLVREAIEAEMPSAVKRSLQRRALNVLLSHGAPPADAATLVMEVARPGDQQAIDLLARATTEIGRVSPSVAAQLGRRLLELTPETDPSWSSRVVETIDLLVHSGQAAEAENLIVRTSGRIDHDGEAAGPMTWAGGL